MAEIVNLIEECNSIDTNVFLEEKNICHSQSEDCCTREKSSVATGSSGSKFHVSERLMQLTESQVSALREYVDRQTRVKEEDDPWWNLRISRNERLYRVHHVNYLQRKEILPSKLHNDTHAFMNSKKRKITTTQPPAIMITKPYAKPPALVLSTKLLQNEASSHTGCTIKYIQPNSHLLKPTKEISRRAAKKTEERDEEEKASLACHSHLELATSKSPLMKKIKSKLLMETQATINGKWKRDINRQSRPTIPLSISGNEEDNRSQDDRDIALANNKERNKNDPLEIDGTVSFHMLPFHTTAVECN